MAIVLAEAYYIFTLTHLSLLLPLSFSLVATFSNVKQYLTPQPPSTPLSFLLSMFVDTKPPLLHTVVSVITVVALLRNFNSCIIFQNRLGKSLFQPRLNTAWIFLCTLQLCVGLALLCLIASDIWPQDYNERNGVFSVLSGTFFIGLYYTAVHWTETIVRPIVDDTLSGANRGENWVERVVMGVAFGILWWWRLRDNIGSLVLVKVKREMFLDLKMIDMVSWWLYYLTVTIGVVRCIKGFIWFGKKLFCGIPASKLSCIIDDDKVLSV